MVKRIGTIRSRTRQKFSKDSNCKGKISMTDYFQEFKDGDRVVLKTESSIQTGMYHPRFYGKVGTIAGKEGKCYKVHIVDIKKSKTLIVHPVHLKRLK